MPASRGRRGSERTGTTWIRLHDGRRSPRRSKTCRRLVLHARHGNVFVERDSGNSADRDRRQSNSRRMSEQRLQIGEWRRKTALDPNSSDHESKAFRTRIQNGEISQFWFDGIYRYFMEEDILCQAT